LDYIISWVKTKVQNFGYGAPASTAHINNEVVDAVTSFCHLWSTLTAGENLLKKFAAGLVLRRLP